MNSYGDESAPEGRAAPGTAAPDTATGASAPATDPPPDHPSIPGPAPISGPISGSMSGSGPAEEPDPVQASGSGHDGGRPGAGMAALSLPYQVVAAVALAVIGVLACVHLSMVFLHVAPSNTLTKQHGEAVDGWVYPEFEQNWKLFAPNPLQQNIAVQVRAELAADDGTRRTTGWIDLSAQDAEAIRGSLLPSHVDQNELRRAFDFYLNSHTDDFRPNGLRGRLSENYLRRIVMLRLDGERLGGEVEKIQLRSETRAVQSPSWSGERTSTAPHHRDLPWWSVTAADLPAGAKNDDRTEAGR
ncbi:DUF5819 family protein [Streptomyces sp. NPDC085614]|uniref:DUF5819 family protein n=1 Tax=Streptomyces sp. NPDC085614 TaxID=3365733 RepID=UPI0037D078C8